MFFFGLNPCLNSDLYFIFKTSGTVLLETIVSTNPLQTFPGKQENPSHRASRYINRSLNVCLFFDYELQLGKPEEFINEAMKVALREKCPNTEFLSLIFLSPKKVIKKQTGSARNFLQLPINVCRGAYILNFKFNASIFCFLLLLLLALKSGINKMVN